MNPGIKLYRARISSTSILFWELLLVALPCWQVPLAFFAPISLSTNWDFVIIFWQTLSPVLPVPRGVWTGRWGEQNRLCLQGRDCCVVSEKEHIPYEGKHFLYPPMGAACHKLWLYGFRSRNIKFFRHLSENCIYVGHTKGGNMRFFEM